MKKIYKFEDPRKNYRTPVVVEIELSEDGVFSASASYKDGCGQCLDTIRSMYLKFVGSAPETFEKIYYYWDNYHLNDLHPGTVEQEQFLKNHNITDWANDYYHVCDFLKEHNLYEVEYNGKPYRFGSGWLKYDIPEKDLEGIKNLF